MIVEFICVLLLIVAFNSVLLINMMAKLLNQIDGVDKHLIHACQNQTVVYQKINECYSVLCNILAKGKRK